MPRPRGRVSCRTCPATDRAPVRPLQQQADRVVQAGGCLSGLSGSRTGWPPRVPLPFPLASHLGDGLRELRIGPVRVTYWFAPGRRAVLLTVFRKTRMREREEVLRAQRARKLCEAEHSPAGEHAVHGGDEEAR
ncbi:type II toxin-antitoxin system RelE/ParE family toxin [Streptomyces sp. YIM B13508]|uniref:type II toxin-antitoxin system RelE/ParE family toxin n=1 Tax=Streptomyces sp. YIM B13508 TaxID=3366315 RepID=UPI0036C97B65